MIKKLSYLLKSWVLTRFGDIKIFPWPMFIVYSPTTFKIKGDNTRRIMEIIEPGDVIMRSFVNYLDGYFIPTGESGCSHTGIFAGNGKVIHAMAEGIVEHDIIDFCRCDKIIVMRPTKGQKTAIRHAKKCLKEKIPYDFDFESGNKTYYCHEFTASCYPNLGIEKLRRKAFKILSSPEVYLADSFFICPKFYLVYDSKEDLGNCIRIN